MLSDVMIKVKNCTAWSESTVFISLVNLLKSKFMRIALCTPIAHVNDSEYHFPDVDLSPTSASNSG